MRGNISDLNFSPDGKNLAFTSNRGDHSFIGIFDLAAKSIEYPDPSVDIDGQPVWSPDGKWLAFFRTPNRKDKLPFTEMREASPWSIRLVDLAAKKAKEIFKADEGRGSILHTEFPVADNLLLWADGNELVFAWERDGWQHLYAMNAMAPAAPRILTPGDGEVESMFLSEDRKSVVYNSNIGDSHRRHIWKVNVSDGKTMQLSKGVGIEWSAAATVSGVAVLRSTATAPGWPSAAAMEQQKKSALRVFPAAFPEKLLVTPQVVSFAAKDSMQIHAEIFLPPGYQPTKRYPALIFFHGRIETADACWISLHELFILTTIR